MFPRSTFNVQSSGDVRATASRLRKIGVARAPPLVLLRDILLCSAPLRVGEFQNDLDPPPRPAIQFSVIVWISQSRLRVTTTEELGTYIINGTIVTVAVTV